MSELQRIEFTRGAMFAHGAHVVDWRAADGRPVLFVSSRSRFEPGQAIRGGVPVIFPWFGDDPEARGRPAHGFARRQPWRVVGSDRGTGRAEFELCADAATRAQWPHAFALRLAATFGDSLQIDVGIENRGDAPFRCEAALHTYLLVGDVRSIAVRGLQGATYLDKTAGMARVVDRDPAIAFARECDRTYVATDAPVVVDDPELGRRITVTKTSARSTIVWNPWAEKGRKLADLGDDQWPRMVCVESGNVADDAMTVAPGASGGFAVRIDCAALPSR